MGTGSITANGGNGFNVGTTYGGGGGGGRIALTYLQTFFTGSIQAFGGVNTITTYNGGTSLLFFSSPLCNAPLPLLHTITRK
jgi:hypothetical protein